MIIRAAIFYNPDVDNFDIVYKNIRKKLFYLENDDSYTIETQQYKSSLQRKLTFSNGDTWKIIPINNENLYKIRGYRFNIIMYSDSIPTEIVDTIIRPLSYNNICFRSEHFMEEDNNE